MQSPKNRFLLAVRWMFICSLAISPLAATSFLRTACAEDMKWIWTPAQPQEKNVPAGSVLLPQIVSGRRSRKAVKCKSGATTRTNCTSTAARSAKATTGGR